MIARVWFAGLFLAAAALSVQPEAAAARGSDIQRRIDSIVSRKPDIVMIGNSMQGVGIHFGQLSSGIGRKVMDMRAGGSMNAWKYLILKNVVAKAPHKVQMAIVVTRQNNITSPRKRLEKRSYRSAAESVATSEDEEFDRLALPPGLAPWPFGRCREPDQWDFQKNLEISLLPYMIRTAREADIKLVIVRHKKKWYVKSPQDGDRCILNLPSARITPTATSRPRWRRSIVQQRNLW